LFPHATFKVSSCILEPGDTLILFTDGITEAANQHDEQFRIERLRKVVERYSSAAIDELPTAILAAVEKFTCCAHQDDDLTLLIIRYQGEGEDPKQGVAGTSGGQ
jgi:sigma-B regulation protein RsbU (phosphoserine phosphatase)